MTRKDQNKLKLLEYLGNPDNEWLCRIKLSTDVLHYKTEQGIHKCFCAAELDEIEREALAIRRSKYSGRIAAVDDALLKRAMSDGDPQAAKLAYQRFEAWAETRKEEHSGAVVVQHISNVDEALNG